MKLKRLWVMVLLAGVLGLGKTFSQDPLKVGPDIYKPLFENERVRVMTITFAPGAKIAMHHHPDHMAYLLTDGKLKITNSDGKVTDLDGKAGQIFWMDAVSHMAENPGSAELKGLVFELKEPKPKMKAKVKQVKK